MDKGAASDEYHPEFHFAIAAAPRRLYRFRALQEEDKVGPWPAGVGPPFPLLSHWLVSQRFSLLRRT